MKHLLKFPPAVSITYPLFITGLLLVSIFGVECNRANVSGKGKGNDIGNIFKDTLYSPRYASGFEILADTIDGSRILVKTSSPWQGASSVNKYLMISRNGRDVTSLNFDGQILTKIPQRVVCMSSTQVAMLEELGLQDRIVGVSGIDFISSDYVRKNRKVIVDVGYENNIDYEALLSARPDLILLYGITGENPMEKKLEELKIPFLYVGEYLEESPLGKAEWIIALAEVMGERGKGFEVFSPIPREYNLIKEKIQENITHRPTVMLNLPYRDSWFMPPNDSYMVTLINDAGGKYIMEDDPKAKSCNGATFAIDLEEAYKKCNEADIWLNQGSEISSKKDLLARLPKFSTAEIMKSGLLYNNTAILTPSGGNGFYEQGVMKPQLILRDIAGILHPEIIDEPLFFYKPVK